MPTPGGFEDEFFDFVIAQSGGLLIPPPAVNANFFSGPYPAEQPDRAGALIYRGGQNEAPDRLAHARYQVLCRGLTKADAQALYKQVRAIISGTWGWDSSNAPISAGQQIYSVMEFSNGDIGFDGRGRFEVSSNFAVVIERLF